MIHIISVPFSGAIDIAQNLSLLLQVPFINEPFKSENIIHNGSLTEGGGIPNNCNKFIALHTTAQFSNYNYDDGNTIIFIDCRFKWQSLINYAVTELLYEKYNRTYNIEFNDTVEITDDILDKFNNEITNFKSLSDKLGANILYSEDFKPSTKSDYLNNLANLTIVNKDKLINYYENISCNNIVLLVQSEMTWNGFRTIYHEIVNNTNYTPKVIVLPIPYDNAVDEDKLWRKTTEHTINILEQEGIPYYDLSLIDDPKGKLNYLKNLNPKYVLLATKDDWYLRYSLKMTCKEFSQYFKAVYIPYYGATIVDLDLVHTSSQGHIHYWKIIADSPLYSDELINHNPNNVNRVINVGHPKIEGVYNIRSSKGHWPLQNSTDKLKIIWAPHWSCPEFPDWSILGGRPNRMNFGSFWQNYMDFYEYAALNEDRVQFVFRPHPLLKVHAKFHNYYNKFKEFMNLWTSLPNVYCEMAGLYNDTFAASDLMITEGISFLIENPIATNKPLIKINNGVSCDVNELGKLASDYAMNVSSFNEIKFLLDNPNNLVAGDSTPLLDYLIPYRQDTSKKILNTLDYMYIEDLFKFK